MKTLKTQDLLKALNIKPFDVKKVRQLTSKVVNIVFIDGHKVTFNLSNSIIIKALD